MRVDVFVIVAPNPATGRRDALTGLFGDDPVVPVGVAVTKKPGQGMTVERRSRLRGVAVGGDIHEGRKQID